MYFFLFVSNLCNPSLCLRFTQHINPLLFEMPLKLLIVPLLMDIFVGGCKSLCVSIHATVCVCVCISEPVHSQ